MPLFSPSYTDKSNYQTIVKNIVPLQESGGQSNVAVSVTLPNSALADEAYLSLKLLLLDVTNWHRYIHGLTARFFITDKSGREIHHQPMLGDHLKIGIPGPALRIGSGFDWTSVNAREELRDGMVEMFYLRATPSANPRSDNPETAHFLNAGASTTFIVLKEKRTVRILIKSRNEVPNTKVPARRDRYRNRAVGFFAGVYLSRLQWSKLARALMRAGIRSVRH